MPTVDANGCKMYYEVDDFTDPWTSAKETVWLQHGVGRSTKFWYHWVPALAREYRVVRRDMRGHGQSSAPPPDHKWSLDELAEDMLAFMDAVGLERVHYLGESIGGIIGILFATRWPERLKSLRGAADHRSRPWRSSGKTWIAPSRCWCRSSSNGNGTNIFFTTSVPRFSRLVCRPRAHTES
jgi:pimeloyl-ACP methyl ester carboxylesterase